MAKPGYTKILEARKLSSRWRRTHTTRTREGCWLGRVGGLADGRSGSCWPLNMASSSTRPGHSWATRLGYPTGSHDSPPYTKRPCSTPKRCQNSPLPNACHGHQSGLPVFPKTWSAWNLRHERAYALPLGVQSLHETPRRDYQSLGRHEHCGLKRCSRQSPPQIRRTCSFTLALSILREYRDA